MQILCMVIKYKPFVYWKPLKEYFGKQRSPWWNTATCGISSGPALFAKINTIFAKINTILMDWSAYFLKISICDPLKYIMDNPILIVFICLVTHVVAILVFHSLFKKSYINPFKPNGISHYYQLDQFISALRVVRWYFSFLFNLNSILQRLIWVCTLCLCPTKRMLGLYGLKVNLTVCLYKFYCNFYQRR